MLDLITAVFLVSGICLDCLIDDFLDFCLVKILVVGLADSDIVVEEVSEDLLASDRESCVIFIESEQFLVIFVVFWEVENTSEVRVD